MSSHIISYWGTADPESDDDLRSKLDVLASPQFIKGYCRNPLRGTVYSIILYNHCTSIPSNILRRRV